MERKIYSVTETNYFIKNLLDNEKILREILIRGEISNFKIYPSGHWYFSLKDAEGSLRCVMFRGQAEKLRFQFENGMSVIASGRIGVFVRDGAYILYCNTITPEGAGDLAVAFEQLKQKLYHEGLFNPAYKQKTPLYPERIGIITSAAGAAARDMIKILKWRYPIAKVILLPVRVQGTEAPPEIAAAIRYANKFHVADVLITGRGGGSTEDLWAFNDERVARAIFESKIPIISAVGHEPDVTIADFVADVRASTPSNAAELVVPDRTELSRWLRDAALRMERAEILKIKNMRVKLRELSQKRVLRDKSSYIQDKRMELARLQIRLSDLAQNILARKKQTFGVLAASLDALSPLAVLGRGYAMVKNQDGKIVKSYRDISQGDKINILLGEGGFSASVIEIQQDNKI